MYGAGMPAPVTTYIFLQALDFASLNAENAVGRQEGRGRTEDTGLS